MNCRNFETTITELARGQMLEAHVKEDTLAHIEECKDCAARFADEQALTAGLRSVAVSAATVDVSLRVEEALLLAFRQRRDMSSSPAVTFIPTKVMPRWMPWSIAAAAALLVVSVLAVSHLLPVGSRESVQQEASRNPPTQAPVPSVSPQEESGAVQSSISNPDTSGPKRTNEITPSYAVDRQRPPVRAARFNGGTIHHDLNSDSATGAREEMTTDFLPLTYDSDLAQLEAGQVVRVELPRSALQSLGLPMNVERSGERVKADVLLGHDGIARAIRFVR
jgi:hypothetical protein